MKATPMRRLAALAAAVVVLLGPASLFGAAPAYAAASLTVSKTTGLKDGDRVTVNGSGFSPNMKQIAVGQCKAGMKGPSDCNLAGGATFVNADASGKIPTVTLSVKEKFGSFDCTQIKCIIGAQILPAAGTPAEVAANTSIVEISFGGAAPAPKKTTPAPDKTTPTAAGGGKNDDTLPTTGPGDEYIVVLLAGTALLLPGVAMLLMMPSRRRTA
ncbi:neocarzinostatin apoprotein domain-containing protein [Melissospora conviva]|uniref:neocarzinostatin apoprotein domain-containing protein n=1 Tax=Melissospora conviva TaxID=3388432 RepID=UPI003C1AA8B4